MTEIITKVQFFLSKFQNRNPAEYNSQQVRNMFYKMAKNRNTNKPDGKTFFWNDPINWRQLQSANVCSVSSLGRNIAQNTTFREQFVSTKRVMPQQSSYK